VNHAINVGLAAAEPVPEGRMLACRGAAVGMFLQAEDLLLETLVPLPGGGGILRVDFVIKIRKVALRAGGDVNEVGHAPLRTRQKTLAPDGPGALSRPPAPDGCPPAHRRGRRCRAAADRPRRPAQPPPPF